MNVLIIDDEPRSHETLKTLLAPSYQDVNIVAQGYNVEEGLTLAKAYQPDLVFLDVEMPDGTGFELLQRLGQPAFYVVFITAYNKYAETAFRFGALDFLTKPIESGLLAETMERARARMHEKFTLTQLQVALETFYQAKEQKLPERIIIHTSKGLELVPVEQILFLDAEANYTDFHYLSLSKKKTVTASFNLKVYEAHLTPYPSFMKVHRSSIINLKMVEQYLKGEHSVVLRDGSQVPVAKSYRDELEGRLRSL